ncbi:plexin-C1 [Aulostomus maculatus]
MLLLPSLVLIFWGGTGLCLGRDGFKFDGDVRHFTVAKDNVYVSTDKKLYQLSRNLTLVQTVSQRGTLALENGLFYRVPETEKWNVTFSVNVLLPFVENGTLISCGVTDNKCGYCELLDLANVSNVLYREHVLVGPFERGTASLAFLVNPGQTTTDTLILTAIEQDKDKLSENPCSSGVGLLYLHATNNIQKEGVFSFTAEDSNAKFSSKGSVEFVDGFQSGFVIYLLSNVRSGPQDNNRVRLIWLESKTSKVDTMKSLRGATLEIPGRNFSRLLAASRVPDGPPHLWSGVFSTDETQKNTELILFDVSADLSGHSDKDPDFYSSRSEELTVKETPKKLEPKKVLFKQNYMTSVLAVRHKTWMVFFIGSGDGQLIKVAVDNNYHTACPIVLYRADDDRKVFPNMYLDEVDHRHVFLVLKNQVKRVAVSKCSTYKSLQDCWSSQDPQCVWCDTTKRCAFADECQDSNWLSIPEDYQRKMVSYTVDEQSSGQITLDMSLHFTMGQKASNLTCQITGRSDELCSWEIPSLQFPKCTCNLLNSRLPKEGLTVSVKIMLGKIELLEQVKLMPCPDIIGPTTSILCQQCIKVGCAWTKNGCSWASAGVTNGSVCERMKSEMNIAKPEIFSIEPSIVSFYGKNNAVLSGSNLSDVTRVRIQTDMYCIPQESPVWNNTGMTLMFHIPPAYNKGKVNVCVLLPDGSCHSNSEITYMSAPSCTTVTPSSSWISGKRKLTVVGSLLQNVEGIVHSHSLQKIRVPADHNSETLTYYSVAAENTQGVFNSTVFLKVANQSLACHEAVTYYPDPVFTTFTSTKTGDGVRITIQKKADEFNMSTAELLVWGVHHGENQSCIMEDKDTSNSTDFFNCEIRTTVTRFRHIKIMYGDTTITLQHSSSHLFLLMLLVLLLIPFIIIVVVIFYRSQQKKLTVKMNKLMENLELDIRNDIRQGFVDLQTEKAELMENVGTIPFLDYKHFASRIFFPETEALMTLCITDICPDTKKVELDECCQSLSRLIKNQLFLTSMVHALEEQKSFTIKDKCTVASLLTVALHSNLSYLTEVMEALLKALMQQSSNLQPKLLLRRTESTVEKLLTNWMSICLYGFLRESVGQHLFLMVSALTQQISKGPVDCVTEKSLYTLSEDWLLWQAQDFSALKLKVLFAVGSDGEVSDALEVNALNCDTVEQVKEKILSTFKAKFGFPYHTPLRDICIEHERDGSFVPLEEVDASSEVIGEVTMLNTLAHYEVPDGATIKVLSRGTHPPLSPQGSVKDDQDFSGKYFHLIDPVVDEGQRMNPERKKLKLKEVHLTKLLSTKVAVHSFVENLFRSIWGMPQSRAPRAVKHFFDFLDSQADSMKIVDPDVLHIWKTNSLPLRFWVNIMKNPQFVFDMEKTPHLDGCLSVIAQAFMDSFSLSDIQLGKHAPTNKLLYAKDIPQFKQEVKVYYKQIRDQPPNTDFKDFLLEESKKHEDEFNEAAALKELFKFIQRYFTEILKKLEENGAPAELVMQLHHVKKLFDERKGCTWS